MEQKIEVATPGWELYVLDLSTIAPNKHFIFKIDRNHSLLVLVTIRLKFPYLTGCMSRI